MDLLNLTLGQLLAVFVPLSAALIALYFYDRSRRRLVVSTLRFWPRHLRPPKTQRHKKLQQPLSLLLQLLAMLLLLLAIADLRFGSFGGPRRHHVLILETSAWMNAVAPGAGNATLLDEARSRAIAYLRAIPADEPVMLIRADGLPTPATPFTTDREVLARAIRESRAGATAANVGGALELARSALDLATNTGGAAGLAERASSGTVGEVAYVGAARVLRRDAAQIRASGIPSLRLIAVGEGLEDAGIRQFTAQRSADEPGRWRVVAQIANRSAAEKTLRLDVHFNTATLGHRTVRVAPESEQAVEFTVRTENPGVLEAVLDSQDALGGDNSARLELPAYRPRPLEVYSERAARWRPLVASILNVESGLRAPAEYKASDQAAVLIFDRFVPPERGTGPALFILPPAQSSPIRVSREVRNVAITRWGFPHPLAEGLNDADFLLTRAQVFETAPGDVVVAECAAGPVMVLREQDGRQDIYVGFDLLDDRLQGRLSTPLLFANIVRWFAPGVFRGTALQASAPGLIEWETPPVREQDLQVFSSEDQHIPWRLVDGRLRFYTGRPGVVTIRTPEQESRLSLTLPEVGDMRWEPPEGTLRGVPPPSASRLLTGIPLWPWFSLLALAILAVDWQLYGRGATAAASAALSTETPLPQPITGLGLRSPTNGSTTGGRKEQLTR